MKQMKYKQVIVVRDDLGMSPGKAAVQVAHAAVLASEAARVATPDAWKEWIAEGYKKVVCIVDSIQGLIDLGEKAKDAGIPCSGLIVDFGLTELAENTTTAIAIGPALASAINPLTKELKAMKWERAK